MATERQLLRELAHHLKEEAPLGLPREYFEERNSKERELKGEGEEMARAAKVISAIAVSETDERMSMDWETLERDAQSCRRCGLCEGRNRVVFGDGKIKRPELVFVGEGPGAEEDKQGIPFVGRAGELLTGAITKGMGLRREDVYIANVVKCRPPENRIPTPEEMTGCAPFLFRQLELLKPKVIVTLGQTPQRALTGSEIGITKLRGNWLEWRGIKVMPTLHPAYLLRNPPAKKDFWIDLQLVMAELGITPPKETVKNA